MFFQCSYLNLFLLFFFGGGGGGGGGREKSSGDGSYHLMWFCEVEIAHREDLMKLLQAAMIIKSLPKYCSIKCVCVQINMLWNAMAKLKDDGSF